MSCSAEVSMKISFITSGPGCADAQTDLKLCCKHKHLLARLTFLDQSIYLSILSG